MSGAGRPGVLVVIPARVASTRLPRKPLLPAAGRPLIVHVWERARQIPSATAVVVATDSPEVAEAVRAAGGEAVMTSASHASGTDRVAEVARARGEELIVNVQGDEPDLEVADVEALVAAMLRDPSLPMGTIAAPAGEVDRVRPSVVKVVRDRSGRALYFSRAAIPHVRDAPDRGALPAEAGAARPGNGSPGAPAPLLRHVGVYAFRRQALLRFAELPPSPLERTEMLEQLRALENGWAVHVVVGRRAPAGIDTPEDYEAFRRRVEGGADRGAEG